MNSFLNIQLWQLHSREVISKYWDWSPESVTYVGQVSDVLVGPKASKPMIWKGYTRKKKIVEGNTTQFAVSQNWHYDIGGGGNTQDYPSILLGIVQGERTSSLRSLGSGLLLQIVFLSIFLFQYQYSLIFPSYCSLWFLCSNTLQALNHLFNRSFSPTLTCVLVFKLSIADKLAKILKEKIHPEFLPCNQKCIGSNLYASCL